MSHFFEDGDYALSKDIDVALWNYYRAYHNEQPLKVAMDFVVVNDRLHNQFDEFKKIEVKCCYSYLKLNELLELYICRHDLITSTIARYNNTYFRLHGNDMDGLCKWIYDIRYSFKHEGLGVFNNCIYITRNVLGKHKWRAS